MNNTEIQKLALDLLHAETEAEVISILSKARYWDDDRLWRHYGDREGNFATIGNQQSRPEAALVEKLVNAVDARLMNECLIRQTDPTSDKAPQSIEGAVREFFEDRDQRSSLGGTVASWSQERRLEEARGITLAVTGSRQVPSITIMDLGEGQTPRDLATTFLSIDRSNKLRIPFVQGKFNMGGTGALIFSGENSLQLLLSRRNPKIAQWHNADDPTAGDWGVTIVRRHWPREGLGEAKTSVFTYLAPLGATENPRNGEVLHFTAAELLLMPSQNDAYSRPAQWGSLLKLYEYQIKRASHVLMKGGLLSRLELLLPDIALPVRVHECRDYGGAKDRSFENSLVGLTARLAENRGGNLEEDFPIAAAFFVGGEQMLAQVYAFKGDRAESYRTNEGIVFTVNGQTHGYLPKTFFCRQNVKMGRLAKSLIVVVDCTRLSLPAREKLFMNSRDRLREGDLRVAIEAELEDLLSNHPALRTLRERRRMEEIAERLEDSKPLEEVLTSILKASPSLEKLFLEGQRLSRPHRPSDDGTSADGAGTVGSAPFLGKPHPTYFRFYKKPEVDLLIRSCQLDRRCRIRFETDVVNDYLQRTSNRGRYVVEVIEGSLEGEELDSSLSLHNGIANWSVTVPSSSVSVRDQLTLQLSVTDDALVEPLVNLVRLEMEPHRTSKAGGGDGRLKQAGHGALSAGVSSNSPGGLALPEIRKVRKAQWLDHGFDRFSACKVIEDASETSDSALWTFYINIDNLYLRTDLKGTRTDPAVVEAKFIYANVLIGLALIHDYSRNGHPPISSFEDKDESATAKPSLDAVVQDTTRALGPFLVPMIDYLGALSSGEVVELAEAGDDD